MQVGPMRLLLEPRSGSRTWAGEKKKRCLRVREGHQFYWIETPPQQLQAGLDSPCQGKILKAKGKQETRLKERAESWGESLWYDFSYAGSVMTKSHTIKITLFTDAEMIILSVPNMHFFPFVSIMASTPPTCQKQNSTCSQLIVISALRFVGLYDIYNIHSCFLYACAHLSDTRLDHWGCWSYCITSCLMRERTLGTRIKGPHVLDFMV